MSDLNKIRLSCNAVPSSCNIRTIPNTGLGSSRRNKSRGYEMDSLCQTDHKSSFLLPMTSGCCAKDLSLISA